MKKVMLFLLLASLALAACSWLGIGGNAALEGARVAAVTTARAGAIAGKYIATNTYAGGRRAVTWTGARTVDGTTATLEALNIIERPVPPTILEMIPEDLLASLTSLQFVSPMAPTGMVVICSADTRWEGEVFYRVDGGELEFEIAGPAEMIVVTLSAAERRSDECLKNYTVVVDEDRSELGRVEFATAPAEGVELYGYPGWTLSEPGVFVIKSLAGDHRYRIGGGPSGERNSLLVACFLPRYGMPPDMQP